MKNIKHLILTLSIMLTGIGAMAQEPDKAAEKAAKDIKKQYAKADKLIAKNKTTKAIEVLSDLTVKYPDYAGPWEKLSQIQFNQYLNVLANSDGKRSLKMTTKDGSEPDSATNALMQLFTEMLNPSYKYKMAYLKTCREATAKAWGTYHCVIMLRSSMADNKNIDKDVSEKAKEFFALAENEFASKNYNAAARYYQQAIDIDSNYYKAKLYLGDAYYSTGNYPSAIKAFQGAIKEQPMEAEPRKYLADALMESESFQEAETVCKESLCLYPDQNMTAKLQTCCSQNNKRFYNYWLERPMLPLSNETKTYDVKSINEKQAFWKPYYEAYDKIEEYADKKGILKENSLTKTKYMEVYAWEQMLKASNADELSYAKKMQSQGYLDCYVFITCFHHDFYEQFKDFAANNKEKMLKYLEVQTAE